MQPRFKELYARALVAGRPHVVSTLYLIADGLRPVVGLSRSVSNLPQLASD
jgi:hypothetical protein